MNKLWQRLAPDLKSLPASEQVGVLERAKKGSFTTGETVLLVAWMLMTFLLVQQVLPARASANISTTCSIVSASAPSLRRRPST